MSQNVFYETDGYGKKSINPTSYMGAINISLSFLQMRWAKQRLNTEELKTQLGAKYYSLKNTYIYGTFTMNSTMCIILIIFI